MKLERTAIGAMDISAAAIDDVIGWILIGSATALVTTNFNVWLLLSQLAEISDFFHEYRIEHQNRFVAIARSMARLRARAGRSRRGQTWRLLPRCTRHRPAAARSRLRRRTDEYARTHGAHRYQRRTRSRTAHARAVHDARHHDVADHGNVRAAVALVVAERFTETCAGLTRNYFARPKSIPPPIAPEPNHQDARRLFVS